MASQIHLNSAQAQQLFGKIQKNWTEKLIRFNSVCAVVNTRRWALLLAKHVGAFEVVDASEEYGISILSEQMRKLFRPSLASFSDVLISTQPANITGGNDYLYCFNKSNNAAKRISNISNEYLTHLSGLTFIGRFWCHIPHFIEDLLALLSVAYQSKIAKSHNDLEFHFILPEISMRNCIMGKNPYFRNTLAISKILLEQWTHGRMQFLFKEDILDVFLLSPINSSMNTKNRLVCFDQIVYNVRHVPRLGHDVLWVYNIKVISMLRKTVHSHIPFVWRLRFQQRFPVTLLQRKQTRRIINIESLATAIRDFFGVNTRMVSFEDTSFWYQVMIMKTTRVFIAAHGAGLTNVIYMRQGSAVIEISNFGCCGEPYFGTLAELSGLLYWNWRPLVASKIITKLDRNYMSYSYISPDNCTRWRRNADIVISEHDILELVKKALLKTEHLE
ncbi:hypothetical protein Gasu2_46110 [Galdieria sulphuraria]|nr:hypothetical protein Gasu2_46110 [Galdieria sulphuraria]